MNELDKSRHTGIFQISPDREMPGILSLNGLCSSLHVWDKKPIEQDTYSKDLTGVLHNQRKFTEVLHNPTKLKEILHSPTKVSLIDCKTTSSGSIDMQGDIAHFYDIFPNYVIFGEEYISNVDEKIIETCFLLDDATDIFCDTSIFGLVCNPHLAMKQIIDSKNSQPDVSMGENPLVAYYTGKSEIFSSNTELGTISAFHAPSYSRGGPEGIKIDNKIYTQIKFYGAITFRTVIDRLCKVMSFFALIVGRPQNLLEFKILTRLGKNHQPLRVYGSGFLNFQRLDDEGKLYPEGILMDAVHDPNGFSAVLKAWLERENDWGNSRGIFFQFSDKQQLYIVPRLINAANMFELMPEEAFPESEKLTSNLVDAKKKAKRIFKKLPQSAERDSVLNALGRVGQLTLKRKIHSRVSLLSGKIEERLPKLSLVTDEAVNCRNYYVHGGSSRINYDKELWTLVFFTQSLEFVFTTTDLIEAGWDIAAWCESENSKKHPFGEYIESYSWNLENLKSLLFNL